MSNDGIRKYLEERERFHRQIEGLSGLAAAAMRDSDAFSSLGNIVEQHRKVVHAAAGSMTALREADLLGLSRLAELTEQIAGATEAWNNRFILPEAPDVSRLLRDLSKSTFVEIRERYRQPLQELQRSIEAMHTPWLDRVAELTSLSAFAELQGIGSSLQSIPAFDLRLTESLRLDLGDWQQPIDWPENIFTDALARRSFYESLGLDMALTAFPTPAFRESLTQAGLLGPPIPFLDRYSTDAVVLDSDDEEPGDNEEELAFARTNQAHDCLMRFETQVRRFIEEELRKAFGEQWLKQQVPGEIAKAWRNKKQAALDAGEPDRALIAYADFTDYVAIITRNDNWNIVFKPYFRRQTFVQESFQRLYPVRICTMHARLITQDDELYLQVETKRLLAAIGVSR